MRGLVAVLSGNFFDYQRDLVLTIRSRLAEAGYGVLCVTGCDAGTGDPAGGLVGEEAERALAARLQGVRGTILLSGVLGHALGEEDLRRLAAAAATAGPVVSLGATLPGVPSVTSSSGRALERLMEHMTRDPSRRRFAFVGGYAGCADTREREAAFRRGLVARGLEVDERLIVAGRFISADSFEAVDALLREGHRFDALVAANDVMAASAVMTLEGHGLAVPDDVIVSGFDDRPTVVDRRLPLTTVRQRSGRQALVAGELLLEALEDGRTLAPDTHVSIEAELVVRRSSRPDGEAPPPDPDLDGALAGPGTDALETLLGERLRSARTPRGIDEDAILEALLATLANGDERLVEVVDAQLVRHVPGADDGHWWTRLARQLDHLRERARVGRDDTRDAAIRRTLARASGRIEEMQASLDTRVGFAQIRRRQVHERLLLRLAACPDHAAIFGALREGFEALGIFRAWVALHDDPASPPGGIEGGARIVFSQEHPEIDADPAVAPGAFDAARLLPAPFRSELECGLVLFAPLVVGDTSFGHLLLDPGEQGTLELAALAASLALALRHVRQVRDLERRAEALHAANDTLSVIAMQDPLTGLPNRARFHEDLERAFADARGRRDEVALLFLDLDGFKLINDTLGHSAGDQLLGLVAARVRGLLRAGDSLARLGGDEFTIVATEAGGERAGTRIADEVLAAIARPFRLGEHVVDVSASIGIARFPTDGEDAETLMRNADIAMYRAKAAGKNRHAAYVDSMNEEAREELSLRDSIRRGLESGEFHMRYQPRVDLVSGRTLGFEALMRWRRTSASGTDEEIGPARFIPVAERCGLIGGIDAFALECACRQASLWQEEGLSSVVSVNLSVRRLQEPTIVEQVAAALRRYRLDPSRLELEITESVAMSDIEGNIEKLEALRGLGLRIAIDDFGTGHSSLNYLRRLPVTSLKVDRSFVSGLGPPGESDPADVAIVQAVVALGSSLGFRLVAEGVENTDQRAFLSALGCDEGQGWHFGLPLEPDDAATRLRLERDGVATARATPRPC